jgi:hypothetical protein
MAVRVTAERSATAHPTDDQMEAIMDQSINVAALGKVGKP